MAKTRVSPNTDGKRLYLKAGFPRLRRYQSLGLSAKVRYANRLIEAGLELADKPCVAWSGGKDSTVLLHLVLKFEPRIVVIFNNTGVEFPETLKFVKRLTKEWDLNLHIAKPGEKNFWWCLEHRGYPLLGKTFTRRRVGVSDKQRKVIESGARLSPACCWYCKEKPSLDKCRALGIDLTFLGIMADESRRRKFNWMEFGDFYCTKKENMWKVHPLSIWREEDIWEYHRLHSLPLCEIYRMGHRRNGCWPCGMDINFPDNHLATLRKSHPKLWYFLMVKKGLARELLKIKLALNDGQGDLFSSTWDLEELLEQRPCFFDRL